MNITPINPRQQQTATDRQPVAKMPKFRLSRRTFGSKMPSRRTFGSRMPSRRAA